MSTALVQAIDALLAFVPDDVQPIPWDGERRDCFDALDRAVYVEAGRRDLKAALPERASGREYIGLTNLPGFGTGGAGGAFYPARLRPWRNALLALRALVEPSEKLPSEGANFSEGEAPAAFREGGKPEGVVLTAPYLERSINWLLKGSFLTKHYGPQKELTTHIKVGRAKAYLYAELLVLRDHKTANAAKREADR